MTSLEKQKLSERNEQIARMWPLRLILFCLCREEFEGGDATEQFWTFSLTYWGCESFQPGGRRQGTQWSKEMIIETSQAIIVMGTPCISQAVDLLEKFQTLIISIHRYSGSRQSSRLIRERHNFWDLARALWRLSVTWHSDCVWTIIAPLEAPLVWFVPSLTEYK